MALDDMVEAKLEELGFNKRGLLNGEWMGHDHNTVSGLSVHINLEEREVTFASRDSQYGMMLTEFLEVDSVEVKQYLEIAKGDKNLSEVSSAYQRGYQQGIRNERKRVALVLGLSTKD